MKKFFGLFSTPGAGAQLAGLFVILVLSVGLFGTLFFYTPTILAIVSLVVFIGIAVVIINTKLSYIRAAGELVLKTQELQSVIENLRDGVVMYSPDFKIIGTNKASEEIFNLRADEMVGLVIDPGLLKQERFRALTQIMFPSLAPTITHVSDASWPQVIDIELDAPPLKLRTILNRIVDDAGRTIGFIKLVRDQTREKNILASKSEFITVAAHQLRTPLTAMRWAFETLLGMGVGTEVTSIARDGLDKAEQSLGIVNDLLDVSKIEGGQFGFSFFDTNIVELVKKIVDEAKIVAKEHETKLIFSSDANSYITRIDKERIAMALTNLIDNAIKYNSRGGDVAIHIEKISGKPFVKIIVDDSGVGIPPESLPNLFTKFYRAPNVMSLEPNGSGLGLYIAKNIIERHGGEIGVESTMGRGSSFWFTLPLDPTLVPQKEIIYEEAK